MPATKLPRAPHIPRGVKPYLTTLMRVPADTILEIAGRDIDVERPSACVCGWLVRVRLAEIANHGQTPDTVYPEDFNGIIGEYINAIRTDRMCAELYGGTVTEWKRIYFGVAGVDETGDCFDDPDEADRVFANIEHAFTIRLDRAIRGR